MIKPGKWVWFEHVSSDPKRAQAFFAEVLGWKTRGFPMAAGSYDMIFLGDTMDSMIGGYTESSEGRARWWSYSSVEDVDATVAKAIAAGATLAEAPSSLPNVGRGARIVNPAGAELSLFTRAHGDPPDVATAPDGAFFWVELHTPDAKAALDFYAALGFTHTTMGDYHVIAKDGVDRGGVSDHIPAGGKPHWLPYVHVGDTDAVAALTTQHGGKVLVGPEDIPTIGRFAIIADPTGAMLAVMRPEPR